MNMDVFRWNVLLTTSERRFLTYLRGTALPENLAKRVDALLKYHEQSKLDRRQAAELVCREVGVQTAHFLRWVEHFKVSRTKALLLPTSKRAGKRKTLPEIETTIRQRLLESSFGHRNRQSTRSIAKELRVSHNTVARILRNEKTSVAHAGKSQTSDEALEFSGAPELIGFYAHRSTLVMAFRNVPRLRGTVVERGRKPSNEPRVVKRRITDSYRTGMALLTAIVRFDASDSNRSTGRKGIRTSASAYAHFLGTVNDQWTSQDQLTFVVKSGYNGQEPQVHKITSLFPRIYCIYRNKVDPWLAAVSSHLAFIAKASGVRQKCGSVYALLRPLIDYIQLPERNEIPFLWVKNAPMDLVRFRDLSLHKPR